MNYVNAMNTRKTYTLLNTTVSRAQIARAIAAAKGMGIKLTVTVIN